MATRRWTVTGQYRLPAGKINAVDLAAFYIDGDLFTYNIPVVDGKLMISVKPQNGHTLKHWFDVGIPSFRNGVVERIGHQFSWWPQQNHWQSGTIFYNGYPYGMGLNTVGINMTVDTFPLLRDIVYDASFTMEVEI